MLISDIINIEVNLINMKKKFKFKKSVKVTFFLLIFLGNQAGISLKTCSA